MSKLCKMDKHYEATILLFLFIVLRTIAGHAQPASPTVKILARVSPDGVDLRWAPTNATLWLLGNQHGYRIDRYTLTKNGELLSQEPTRLQAAPIRPLSPAQLSELGKTLPEAEALGELIYGTESESSATQWESPAQLLKKSEDLDNRFGMALLLCDLTPDLARAAGLFFKDTAAVKGTQYIYKISPASALKIATEPGVMVVDVKEPKALQPFNDLAATFGDQTVTLSWPMLTHAGIYTAYWVEKSTDGKTFTSTTDLPYLPMSETNNLEEANFVDSLENNSTTYFYRVIGITPFGEKGPPSNTVSGKGKDNLSGLLILREVSKDAKKNLKITWEFPAEAESKVSGFIVERSGKADGPYTPLSKKPFAKKMRSLTDALPAVSTYYRVHAVDPEGSKISSSYPYFLHIEDNAPPAIPLNLTGTINTNGVAILSWTNNNEVDLLGYRVFVSHDLKQEFVEVTTDILPVARYRDTVNIRVLNKEAFYKVVAVDNNFNTSDYSQPLVLHKPDVIAPAAPVFGKIDIQENAVVLRWTNSYSNDAARYSLHRLVDVDTAKTLLLDWRANRPRNEFEDKSIVAGKAYRYVLSVFDSSGNVSSTQSKVITIPSGVNKAVSDITATIERDKKIITLRWNYDQQARKCLLYKRRNDEPFTLYQTLQGVPQQFTDKEVIINNTYSYKIQLVLEKNGRTELSKELKVPF